MAYTFSDADGKNWPGPSIHGWQQVINFLAIDKVKRPALQQLIKFGHTNMLIALATECTNLAKAASTQDVKDTLTKLATLARKADEIIILES